jgi:hypothetical protein
VPQELLVTGGGDGTLRLWDPLNGSLLHTLELPPVEMPAQQQAGVGGEGAPKEQQQQGQEAEGGDASSSGDEAEEADAAAAAEDAAAGAAAEAGEDGEGARGSNEREAPASEVPVPLALAASPDGGWVVVAVDGRDDICLLRLDWQQRQLVECGWFALPGLHLPACLAFEASGRLWAAGGPVADDSTAAFLACGSINGGQLAAAQLPDWLPAEAAQQVEARVGDEAELLAAAAERRRLASQVLRKRRYSLQQLEHRKRQRRDRVAAAAAVEGEPQQ